MIPIFTIDDQNRIIDRTELVPPLRSQSPAPIDLTPDMPVGEQIVLRPDLPPLGTPEFDIWLRNWHAAHNPAKPTLNQAKSRHVARLANRRSTSRPRPRSRAKKGQPQCHVQTRFSS